MAVIQQTASFLKTLFLFGKSDIPAAALPTIAVALVLTGFPDLQTFTAGVAWLEIHLLTFQIKNQIDGIGEDRIAKPYRPLPAGRLSLSQAKKLYYLCFALMLVTGALTSTLPCTLAYAGMILAYNEGRLAEYSLSKNILAAGGLICYCWGVTVIFDQGRPLQGLKLVAVMMLGAIFATTGHASDFRDRTADALMGRKTIPLLLPARLARWSLAGLIAAWTAGLMCLWQPPLVASLAFASLAIWTLVGFVVSHEEKDDRRSYVLYGQPAADLHPAAWRVRVSEEEDAAIRPKPEEDQHLIDESTCLSKDVLAASPAAVRRSTTAHCQEMKYEGSATAAERPQCAPPSSALLRKEQLPK